MDHLLSIRAFVTVVRLESFTKAATQLDMSKAALSRAIGNLESHTQTRLLNRSTRHVSLAEGAQEYFAICTDLLNRLVESEQRLINERSGSTGVLRIAAHPFAMEAGLPRLISQYRTSTPNVDVVVSTASESLRLGHGRYDAAVYPRQLILDSDAVCRPLLSSPLLLVASRSYLDVNGRHRSPDDLSGHVLISCEPDADAKRALRLECRGNVLSPANPALRMVVNESTAVQLALSGFGMALLPEVIVSKYVADDRLQVVFPDCRVARREADLDVAFMRRQTLPRRTRDFVDACVRFFGMHSETMPGTKFAITT